MITPLTKAEFINKLTEIWLGEEIIPLSVSFSGTSFYSKDYNGVGCVLGCLMPEEINRKPLEFISIVTLVTEHSTCYSKQVADLFCQIPTIDLDSLQTLHDASTNPQDFRKKLKLILAEFEEKWLDS